MTIRTLDDVTRLGDVEILDHLDRQVTVPVITGVQFQGDVAVVPADRATGPASPVPAEGVPVVRGENGGNTHLLVADGPVLWAPHVGGRPSDLTLGFVTVPDGAVAYLIHPEHGANGIGPGSYEIRRQREMAEEIRLVAD